MADIFIGLANLRFVFALETGADSSCEVAERSGKDTMENSPLPEELSVDRFPNAFKF